MGRRLENGSTDSVGTSERGDRVRFWLVVSVERGDETAAEGIVVSKKRRCHAGAANLHIDPGKEAYRSGRREPRDLVPAAPGPLCPYRPKI